MSDTFETDVAIIGAGPAGMFAIFECGMMGFSCHAIDALDQIGGQCTALYPEKPIYDIPAAPSILAGHLIEQLEKQAAPFNPVYHTGQKVVKLNGEAGRFTVVTSKGITISAKAIIIAAGAGAFGPQRPPLEGLEHYEGTSVFYALRQKDICAGKHVVIAGGGDSAVDWALALQGIAAQVSVVHRRDKFRAAPDSVQKLQTLAASGACNLVVPFQLDSLEGADGQLTYVGVADITSGAKKRIKADILLPFFGLSTDLGPIAEWGLGLTQHHISVEAGTQKTTISGIYAVGDVASYEHKIRLILTGFAEGAQAAHAIHRQIYPDREIHMEYSTTKGLPH
ncbi:MAG: NAD(P)/FAD-dependent oxidoreductase [Pseudobdellovibrionaceae bacterium]